MDQPEPAGDVLVTEMEYQHLVFEEFARKVQPAINPFQPFAFAQTDLNPAVTAEFAHAVYRFGHSMLTDTISRRNEDAAGPDGEFGTSDDVRGDTDDVSLLEGFLNPPKYTDGGSAGDLTSEEAAGSIVMGMTDQTGNELDEFVTETLRDNLLGLPLDLATVNMTRARSEGVPRLNAFRKQLHAATNDGQLQPYTSWVDFGENLKHPESLVNYVFEKQLTDLQNGDRVYYLARTPGMNLHTQLEGNSFAELIMRNTNAHTLKADVFATADCTFELKNLKGTPAGLATSGNTVADDPQSDCDETAALIRMPDCTIKYRAVNSVDPAGINGQSVYNGAAGVDRVYGGNDNDTFLGRCGQRPHRGWRRRRHRARGRGQRHHHRPRRRRRAQGRSRQRRHRRRPGSRHRDVG